MGCLSDDFMSSASHERRNSHIALANHIMSTVVLPDESMLSANRMGNDINAISSMNVCKSNRARMQRLTSEMKESIVILSKQSSSHDSSYNDNNGHVMPKHMLSWNIGHARKRRTYSDVKVSGILSWCHVLFN